MEGNFGCLLLVGWVGRGGWLVGGGTSVQLPWPSNTVHKLSVVKRSFKIQVFLFQNTRVFRILLPCSELTKLLIIIGDGGDSNQQAHSGADEDIEQQAVEEKVRNSPKNKNTH